MKGKFQTSANHVIDAIPPFHNFARKRQCAYKRNVYWEGSVHEREEQHVRAGYATVHICKGYIFRDLCILSASRSYSKRRRSDPLLTSRCLQANLLEPFRSRTMYSEKLKTT